LSRAEGMKEDHKHYHISKLPRSATNCFKALEDLNPDMYDMWQCYKEAVRVAAANNEILGRSKKKKGRKYMRA